MDERSPQSLGGSPVSIHLYVDDADTMFSQAIGLIKDPSELHELTAFFAWAAWASAARWPGKSYSYTNNFPAALWR